MGVHTADERKGHASKEVAGALDVIHREGLVRFLSRTRVGLISRDVANSAMKLYDREPRQYVSRVLRMMFGH
ncbi:hypothetical protein Pan216_06330 [Planctomycetes bacterium Pan216]|uniref:Uncharacterized protein n=1 Tax=Kolteria novifilia TaxID=2527975 RepID=A0A518AYN1_9BACT|nr:hypothetical protein Pan216_06330 [Planctomycetes bacterium Pan216]